MAIAVFFASPLVLCQDPTWMNLGHVARANDYFVILRDGTCLQGKIQSAQPDSLRIAVPNPTAKLNPNIVAAPRLASYAGSGGYS
jgi:hypothetical protein